MNILAYCLFGVGALVSALNFYLSFVRSVVCRLRRRAYRFSSGIPLFGSLLLVASFFCFPSGHPLRWAALIIALLDTGGLHWFFGTILYHSLRDRHTQSGGDRAA